MCGEESKRLQQDESKSVSGCGGSQRNGLCLLGPHSPHRGAVAYSTRSGYQVGCMTKFWWVGCGVARITENGGDVVVWCWSEAVASRRGKMVIIMPTCGQSTGHQCHIGIISCVKMVCVCTRLDGSAEKELDVHPDSEGRKKRGPLIIQIGGWKSQYNALVQQPRGAVWR